MYMTTEHPCKGRTKAQRETFERIAIGDDRRVNPKVAAKLMEYGLIEQHDQILSPALGDPVWLTMRVKRYSVPIAIHIQFCQWASEQESPPAKGGAK